MKSSFACGYIGKQSCVLEDIPPPVIEREDVKESKK